MPFSIPPPPLACRRAFTLVEILVVLGIIMLLAAILFPMLGKARSSARSTTCASNLRQIGLAMQLYLEDSRYFYPRITIHGTDVCTWTHGLASYVKQTSVFNCPSNPNQFYVDQCGPDKRENDVLRFYDGGYIINAPNSSDQNFFNDHAIHRPAQMILVLDGADPLGFTKATSGTGSLSQKDLMLMDIELRHDDAVNALFADGHVKRQTSSELLDRSKWTLSGSDVQPTPLPQPTFPPPPPF